LVSCVPAGPQPRRHRLSPAPLGASLSRAAQRGGAAYSGERDRSFRSIVTVWSGASWPTISALWPAVLAMVTGRRGAAAA